MLSDKNNDHKLQEDGEFPASTSRVNVCESPKLYVNYKYVMSLICRLACKSAGIPITAVSQKQCRQMENLIYQSWTKLIYP